MRNIILFLLFPLFVSSQDINENWTTSIADIEFSEKKIIYTYSYEAGSYNDNIKPIHYNSQLLDLKVEMEVGYLFNEDYKNLVSQLYDYLDGWYIGQANKRDKHNFLEVCAILIIWNIGNDGFLPENTIKNLSFLENDLLLEVSGNAKLVLELYDFYNEN